jgi:hypothetical protein
MQAMLRPLALARRWLFLSSCALALAGCGSSSSANPGDGGGVPTCTSTVEFGPAMSAATFCQIFVASCPLSLDGYTTMSECVASYSALTTTKPKKQECQSFHLCQAVEFPAGDNRASHCGHATGFAGNQACEQID